MTDEKEVVNVTDQEAPDEQPEKVEEQGINVNDMQIAYLVGLQPDGDFVFQVFGQRQGLIELLGIHQHATRQLERLQDQKAGAGDVLTLELAKGLQIAIQKLDQLLKVIAPKTPDNNL